MSSLPVNIPSDTTVPSPLTVGTNLLLSSSGLTAPRTFTFPDLSDTVVTLTATQTLTNKTLGATSLTGAIVFTAASLPTAGQTGIGADANAGNMTINLASSKILNLNINGVNKAFFDSVGGYHPLGQAFTQNSANNNQESIIGRDVTNGLVGFQLGQAGDWFSVLLKGGSGVFFVTASGNINMPSLAGFVAGDKYVIIDGSGNLHKSGLGPAS